MVTVYSNHCVMCDALKDMLDKKHIDYKLITDVDYMTKLGLTHMPVLELEDGTRLRYPDAVKWVNKNSTN